MLDSKDKNHRQKTYTPPVIAAADHTFDKTLFTILTQAPLESITKTYFTALQLYLASPWINQQIVNPPTQKKKTRKDLDTLWLKMQEPDYNSRNSTKKKVGLAKTFIERASANTIWENTTNTRTGPHCHLTLLKPYFSESSN